MKLDVLSGTAYRDAATSVPNQKAEANVSEGVSNLTITEAPVATTTAAGNQAQASSGQNQNTATEDQIRQAILQANNKLRAHRTRCEFAYHDEINRVSIKIYDQRTNELIREIPPEETLDMIQKIWEIAGILVDEKR